MCLQIYFIANLNGAYSNHRFIANNQLFNYLTGGRGPVNSGAIVNHMQGGRSSGFRNPEGFEWHHPVGRPNELWLVLRCEHRDPLISQFIHSLPGGGGGFSQNFPGGYR